MADAKAEAERYRLAAEETLGQLEWCVDYLYRIGKARIARVIQENERTIRARMEERDKRAG